MTHVESEAKKLYEYRPLAATFFQTKRWVPLNFFYPLCISVYKHRKYAIKQFGTFKTKRYPPLNFLARL